MSERSNQQHAVELLQQLGLKEYEARSLVALARRESGTAKEISESSDVPRTRVYDAIRVLESKGLVETQHTSPQVFRAVAIDEAVNTLQSEYVDRASSLRGVLRGLEPPDEASGEEVTHEVWALNGEQGISSRAAQLIEGADEEVVLVIGHERAFTDQLAETLKDAQERGVRVVVGAVSETLRASVAAELPDVEVFVSGLEWLEASSLPGDTTEISRLLLVDREAILVSSFSDAGGGQGDEQAVFGRGFDNGLVAITRRMLATGLLPESSEAEAD